MTFVYAHNYGGMLQAYALRKYMENLGCDVTMIPYCSDSMYNAYSCNPFGMGLSLRKRVKKAKDYFNRVHTFKKFTSFQEECLKVNSDLRKTAENQLALDEYDLTIYGSDQIWNCSIDTSGIFYGKGNSSRKIAYACSLGKVNFNESEADYAGKYLKDFDAISVREDFLRGLLKRYVNTNINVCVDPVFLIDKSEWKLFEKEVSGLPLRYILLYILEENEALVLEAKNKGNELNIPVFEIHPLREKRHKGIPVLNGIGPREFIHLVRNAEIVVTNSFHGLAFSIIFGKRVLCRLVTRAPGRLENLLSVQGINYRIDETIECEFDNMSRELTELIDDSKQFLSSSMV